MIIYVHDAFGVRVGHAEVEWYPVENPGTLAGELRDSFDQKVIALLPTRNPAMAWRLEVWPADDTDHPPPP